ncbi:MAG: L,D-transpeptidase family protein [Cellulomonas sp.]
MKRPNRSSGVRLAVGTLAAVTVAAMAVGTMMVTNRLSPGSASARGVAATSRPAADPTSPASSGSGTASGSNVTSASPSPTAVPLHVRSITPDAATRLTGTAPIVVLFDEPVAADGPMPQIQPAVAGTWSQPDPTTLRFDPAAPLVPDTSLTVTIAGGAAGVRADNGGLLSTATTITYQVADGSPLRLQQILAELHYLPVDFTPTTPEVRTAAAQGAMAFNPPPGQFAMRFASTPAPLAALWQPGAAPALTRGAVMTFEKVHSLVVDGVAGPAVWTALLHDAVDQTMDPQPYSWAWTTLTHPETLTIWVDGQFVFSSKANTGIPAAPTPTGSWPVYARYRTQTMTGTNPDGTTYNDPGVPYVSYFRGGDAIHGFQRASYGTEQSLGCVELPYAAAAQVWTLIDYGTIVTVTP